MMGQGIDGQLLAPLQLENDGRTTMAKSIQRRMPLVLLALVGGLWCGGCVMADGVYTYHARGVLVEAGSSQPLQDVKLSLALRDWEHPENRSWLDKTAISPDASGCFSVSGTTGLAWGTTYLFGFIPLQRCGQAPTPPPLKEVFLFVRVDEQWRVLRIPLNIDQQNKTGPAERWIELGTVQVAPRELPSLRFVDPLRRRVPATQPVERQ